MSRRDTSSLDFLVGFIVGGAVGAVVGILLAPQSGEETRAQIAERGIELRDELQEKVPPLIDEQRGRVEDAIEKGKEAAAKKRQEILAQMETEKKADEES